MERMIMKEGGEERKSREEARDRKDRERKE